MKLRRYQDPYRGEWGAYYEEISCDPVSMTFNYRCKKPPGIVEEEEKEREWKGEESACKAMFGPLKLTPELRKCLADAMSKLPDLVDEAVVNWKIN